MRPERKTPTITRSWRFTNEFVSRQFSNITVSRAVIVLGILAATALSFTFYPSTTTTAQQRKIAQTNDLSLADATASGMNVGAVSNDNQPMLDSTDGASCTWSAGTNYPITILDQATVSVGGNLYVFGGVSTAIIATANKFDGTTWTSIAPLPVALEYPTAVTDGTNIYILGGADSTGASVNTVYKYDVAANTYTTLAPMPTAAWNVAAEYLNGKIYKFTGTAGTSGSTTAHEAYDVATNTWSAGAPYPAAASFVSSFVKGGFIYGAGGIASVGSVASLKTYRYDPVANTWDDAAIADLPQTRWGAASSRVGYGSNGAWVLAGGYVNGTAAANLSNTVIEWDSATNTWLTNPNMIGERARFTGAVLGQSFYAIGGRSTASSGFVGTNTNQKLTCISGQAVIGSTGPTITSESCGTPNGAPDPGETLTVTLPFTNTGDTPTTALTATLLATGGVTNPSAAQNYGAIAPNGMPVSRTFTFRVDPSVTCGSSITLTFTVADGATTYPNVTRTFTTGVRTVSLSENFDGVTAPALPTGWTSTAISGTGINWVTSTTTPSSAPNAAFAPDTASVNLGSLTSPAVAIASADAQLSFKNQFNTEDTFDGMVLEYSTDNGTTWTDIITGGGSFVSGGYTDTLSTGFMNPLPGRQAWSGNSNGYIDTVVNLPASLNGQSVRFRWLMGSDASVTATGVWVDDVQILGARVCNTCNTVACTLQRRNDFNGDGKTDFATFRPSNGFWTILPNGSSSSTSTYFGAATDKLQPADYDGDGKTDIAVFRSGTWYWFRSSDNTAVGITFGAAGDIPVIGDYVGDNKADLTVYRNGVWYTRDGGNGNVTAVAWGGDSTDVPAPGDFDGDCKTDYAVRRTTNAPSTGATQWYVRRSGGGVTSYTWGTSDMQMALADYNGDGSTDIGVVTSSFNWFVLSGANPAQVLANGVQFGATGDVVVPGDYVGDAAADLAVWKPSTGTFTYRTVGSATTGTATLGASGDIPTARAYQYPLP